MLEILTRLGEQILIVGVGCLIGITVIGWGGYGIPPWRLIQKRREVKEKLRDWR